MGKLGDSKHQERFHEGRESALAMLAEEERRLKGASAEWLPFLDSAGTTFH